jgi:cytoskeletal protein RodZ
MTLADVRDRTGVATQHLEALEAMDLGRLPDHRTVLIAARRYSELVGLDASLVCETALRAWQDEFRPEKASAAPGDGAWLYSPNVAAIRRTAKQPGTADTNAETHLEAFTQTAEVPVVRNSEAPYGGDSSLQFANTGVVPITSLHPRRRFAPRWLQAVLDSAAVLILLGGAALAVHHYEPQWLTDIHLTRGHSPTTAREAGASNQSRRASHASRASHPSHASSVPTRSLVTQNSTASGSVSVIVNSTDYQVLISATEPCWVDATAPSGGAGPVFEGVLQAGDTRTLSPVQGALTVQLGASYVNVQVQVAGKIVQGWSFTPPSAPLTLNFASSPGP